ncbi:hypothetical protein [Acinetobacter pittii]|uniref:hypothetical protein n=1 Tax=Acinetobacter pittii TaxID=48296 RepID=UPI0025B1F13A|nr:hypothetical protein [Acinetobacter pittii]
MPRGDKTAYTAKQKRQAKHIVESEVDRGHSQEEAERIAWSTVNKQDGGGKKKCKHPANTALPSDPISLNLVPT